MRRDKTRVGAFTSADISRILARSGATKEKAPRTVTRGQLTAARTVSLALMALVVWVFLGARSFSAYGSVFPLMVNGFLTAFAALYIAASWFPALTGTRVVEPSPDAEPEFPHLPAFLIGLGGLVLYLYAMIPALGFLTASVIYAVGVVMAVRAVRRELTVLGAAKALAFAVALAGVIYYVFSELLNIHLATGVLI